MLLLSSWQPNLRWEKRSKAIATATFYAADNNKKGILKAYEYLDYAEKMLRNYKTAYGDTIVFDAYSAKETFSVLN